MAYRPNQTYQSIRNQMERETEVLIQERSGYQGHQHSAGFLPYDASRWPQGSYQRRPSYPGDHPKKAELKNRIREIIDLCKDENGAVTRQLGNVYSQEQGVYNLLQQADVAPTESVAPNQFYPTTSANIPPTTSVNYTPIRQNDEVGHPGQNLSKDIRTLIERSGVRLNEESLHLIGEIERRSLAEIERLRGEKLGLITQLNEEIRGHNGEKKKNAQLLRQLDYYRQSQGGGAARDVGYQSELKGRVAYLESLLQQMKQGEMPDFKLLYAQGEAIRQDTLRLLRLKESKGYADDPEKRRLKEEVQQLQRKIQHLEQGRNSKPSYEVINEEYSPIAPNHKRRDSHRKSANEYDSLVMEMRKITNN